MEHCFVSHARFRERALDSCLREAWLFGVRRRCVCDGQTGAVTSACGNGYRGRCDAASAARELRECDYRSGVAIIILGLGGVLRRSSGRS